MTGGEQPRVGLAWRRRIVVGLLVAVVLIGGLTVVVTTASGGARAATPQSRALRFGIVNLQVTTFNPMKITLVDEYIVIYNVMSTLITNDKSYGVKPDLASSWSVTPNGTVWTIHLVHNAIFTDPTNPADTSHKVTSADVLYTYGLQELYSASILHSYTQQISSMAAPDPYTVVIVTKEPYAAMYSTLSVIPIMPQYWWSAQANPINTKPKFPIGSGPLYFDTSLSNLQSYFVLDRSPNYFGQLDYCQFARPNQIWFLSYTDPGTMVLDFTSGTNGLNGMIGLDPISYQSATLTGFAPAVRIAVDEGFVGEFSINVMPPQLRSLTQFRGGSNNPLLLNLTVRRAIAMSINKSYLVQDALLGLGSVGDSLVPDTNPWHYTIPSQSRYDFNPGAARTMLYNAGWKYDSAGNAATNSTFPLYQKGATNGTVYWPLSFRFYTLNTEPNWGIAAADIVGWLQAAGFQTTDRLGNTNPGYGLYSINQMSTYWLGGDYDMWLWDWVFTPASDPSTDILEVETTGAIGPTSDNFYSNSTYDALYNQSLVTVNHTARQTIVDQMQQMLYDYSSYIIPYYQMELFAVRNDQPSTGSFAWTGWGDWNRYVGLTPDSDLPNLWMQVYPANQPPPSITSFPSQAGYATQSTAFSVVANDPNGDALNYTWNWGDGSPASVTTTNTTTHKYSTAGTYTVSVTVSDGEWPACGSAGATIAPFSTGQDQPPALHLAVAPQVSGTTNANATYVNRTVYLNTTVSDFEGQTVTVIWHFGEGAAVTEYGHNTTLSASHTYHAVGVYETEINYTDNATGWHYVFTNLTVESTTPGGGTGSGGGGGGGGTAPPPAAVNPLINYGVPIAIVAVIVIAVAAVLMRRSRQRKTEEKEEGTEETRQNPPSRPPP